MHVEDIPLNTLTIQQLMQDPQRSQHIIKIMIQSLYDMGYYQSAHELEIQSNVTYYTNQVLLIKQKLSERDYKTALFEVQKIPLKKQKKQQIQNMINKLLCEQYINKGQLQLALQLLKSEKLSKQIINELCQRMVIPIINCNNNSHNNQHDIHDKIVEECVVNPIPSNSLNRIIKHNLMMQKYNSELSLELLQWMNKDYQKTKYPPMKIQAISKDKIKNGCKIIKIDPNGYKVCAIIDSDHKNKISIWKIDVNSNGFICTHSKQLNGQDNIQSISWNYVSITQQNKNNKHFISNENIPQCIAVCGFKFIYIINSEVEILSTITLDDVRSFNAQWNPLNNLLYISGYYNHIYVYSYLGQQFMKIQPLPKLRQIILTHYGKLYGISATSSYLLKYCLCDEKEQNFYQANQHFMSITCNEDQSKICVSNSQHIYVFDASLTLLMSFSSPQNPQANLIEVAFYDPWIIILCNKFQAYNGNDLHYSWPGSYTFHISRGKMVSGKKQLVLWRPGLNEDGITMNEVQSEQAVQQQQNSQEDNDDEQEEQQQSNEAEESRRSQMSELLSISNMNEDEDIDEQSS